MTALPDGQQNQPFSRRQAKTRRWPGWLLSGLLHLAVIIGLIAHWPHDTVQAHGKAQKAAESKTAQTKQPIVQASAISETAVNKMAQHIKQKQQAKAARAKQLEKAAKKARQTLKQTRHEHQRMRQALTKEKHQLAQIKRARRAHSRQLAKARRERAQARKALQKLKHERHQTDQAYKRMRRRLQKAEQAKQQREKALAKLKQQLKSKQHQAKIQELKNRINQEQQAKKRQAGIDRQLKQFRSQIIQAISHEWMLPSAIGKNQLTRLWVKLAPGGRVLRVKVVKSSGNTQLDQSAEIAVKRASPLPVPKEQALFDHFRKLYLTLRPETVQQLKNQ